MTRRHAVPRWCNLPLFGLLIAGLLITTVLPGNRVSAAQKQQPFGWLLARVVDRNGNPVNAIVVIRGVRHLAGRTDSYGQYRATVPQGDYEVTVVSGTYSSTTRRVTVVSGRTAAIRITFTPTRLNAPSGAGGQGPAVSQSPPTVSSLPGPTLGGGGSTATRGGAPSGSSSGATAPSGGSQSSTPAAGSDSSAAVAGALEGSSPNAWGQTKRPAKIRAVKADPGVTGPNGSSWITAEVINPDADQLTYSWQASGGRVSGAGAQVLWAAPQSTGDYTVTATITDNKRRTSSGSIVVSVQPVEAEPAPTEPAPSPSPTGSRDPIAWPFDASSPWNMPVGTGAALNTITGNWNLSSMDIYFNAPQGGWPNTAPIWKARETDPIRTVTVTNAAMPYTNPKNSNFGQVLQGPVVFQFRIPDGAIPSGPWTQPYSSDAVMLVLDPDGRTLHELYGARKDANGIDWKAYDFYRFDIMLDGYGKSPYGPSMPDGDPRFKHTARASGLQMLGGIVRVGEFQNGIKHALTAAVTPQQLNRYGPGGRSFIWPASGSDDPSSAGYATVGNVYMGSLLVIPASVSLDSLPFQTIEGKNVARAMQQYGLYITDTAGGQMVLTVEYAAARELPLQGSYSNPSPFVQDLRLAARYLKVVSNNGPNSVGGGGTPLAPLAPPLASASSPTGGGELWASAPHQGSHPAMPFAASVTALLTLAGRAQARPRRRDAQ